MPAPPARGRSAVGAIPTRRTMTLRQGRSKSIRFAAAAALAAGAVLSDEVVQGQTLGREGAVDLATGAIVWGVLLALLSRCDRPPAHVLPLERRANAIDEVVLAISRRGQADAVLASLTHQACEFIQVEKAVAVLRDQADPRSAIVVAGHGVADLVGTRLGIDEGMSGEVIMTGRPVIVADYPRFTRALQHPTARDLAVGAAVPIRFGAAIQGALCAASTDPARRFGPRELDTLERLAELGAVALEQAALREELERAVESGVEAMAAAVDIRDSYTAEHSDEVVRLARRLGERLGLDEATLSELEFAARLHDVGKIGVPDSILRKDGQLDRSEWEVMRQHPVWGAEMLQRISGLRSVATIVRHEHEHWDGEGYPDGLKEDEIPLGSRIILACDAYHAMTSDRPYRPALHPWVAVSELREGAGGQFDPEVVDALVKTLRERSGSATRLFETAAAGAA
jgi:HD-GYP domain-containing protein (c-di-GMP phosphodiesterase class II)